MDITPDIGVQPGVNDRGGFATSFLHAIQKLKILTSLAKKSKSPAIKMTFHVPFFIDARI